MPAARLDAITKAAEQHDESAIPDLITMLESDDPVVRMAALRTLQLLTGQTLGYDYAAPEWERRDKVQAWKQWYQAEHPGGPQPERESEMTDKDGGGGGASAP